MLVSHILEVLFTGKSEDSVKPKSRASPLGDCFGDHFTCRRTLFCFCNQGKFSRTLSLCLFSVNFFQLESVESLETLRISNRSIAASYIGSFLELDHKQAQLTRHCFLKHSWLSWLLDWTPGELA